MLQSAKSTKDSFQEWTIVSEDLLTTREAAITLGVGTTSIKRWADAGLLQCVKTPGGHRRYSRASVEALIGQTELTMPVRSGRVSDWVALLTGKVTGHHVADALEAERRERGSWGAVSDALGLVLEEIGSAWARGELSVIDEHIASDRLIRGLARCGDAIRVPGDAPAAFLITAEGDEHTVGLAMAEVCLREQGWRTMWAGPRTPVHFACEYVSTADVQLVAVSASQHSRDAALLADQSLRLGEVCRKREIQLAFGGNGLWPENPLYGKRLRSCSELQHLLSHASGNGNGASGNGNGAGSNGNGASSNGNGASDSSNGNGEHE
jgi:MerR family transcriptional regulator, light-induced transcriptional regulator